MIDLDYDQLLSLLAQFVYPLARILAMIGVAPLLGHTAVPRRVKLGLGVVIAVVMFPLMPSPPPLENFEGDLPVVTSAEPLLDLREEA